MTINNWLSTLIYSLLVLPLFLILFDSFYRLLFLIIAPLPVTKKPQNSDKNSNLRLMLLVVARNEQSVIEQTISQLQSQTNFDNSVVVAVLADNCTDQTVQITSKMGIKVYLRCVGNPGKAQALSWFATECKDALFDVDIITILDADTLIDKDFCENIRGAFQVGVEVVQGFVNPTSKDGFPLTTLASFSEILSQKIDDIARSRLHWSVQLRGTGMAFRTDVFCQVSEGLGSQVDDIELSICLAERNILVYFCPDANVFDPKSDNMIGLAMQRGRWLKGQRQIWQDKGKNIIALLRPNLSSWSLLLAMLLKPKTALTIVKLSLVAIMIASPFKDNLNIVILDLTLGSILIDIVYFGTGLKYVSNAQKYVTAFLGLPLLLILWSISWGFSLFSKQGWLRTRQN